MTCIHIQRVKELLCSGRTSTGVAEINPFCECGIVGNEAVGGDMRTMENCRKIGCLIKKEILNILNECNCENSQLALVRNTETSLIRIQNENSSLSREVSGLRSTNYSLSNTNISLQSANSSLQNQLTKKDENIEWGKNQLALVQRSEKEKQNKIDELTRKLTTLQIESDRDKNKIRDLKGELGQSREEYLNQKIGIKQVKLETLAQQLGINQGQIDNLKNAYQQLVEARKNFNQNNINVANANINNLRATLAINPANRQKLCRKCEKLVKLEIELNQVYQEQYEARQEVPPRQ